MVQAEVARAEVVQGIPVSHRSTRQSVPPEKFIAGQPNPRIKKNK